MLPYEMGLVVKEYQKRKEYGMSTTNKLRVGVLMGGRSIEREVSFNSGRTVCDHLDTNRYHIVPIFQTASGPLFILPNHFLHRGKISDFEHRLEGEAQKIRWDDLKQHIDFLFLAVHGRYAEDGTVQGFLEILGIPYLGSKVLASALSMNKIAQKNILRAHGIDTPRGLEVSAHHIKTMDEQASSILKALETARIQPPYIVKPYNEGSSLGVRMVQSATDLPAALRYASTITPGINQAVLIEEKLEGMEFTCITITDYKTGRITPMTPTEVVIEKGSHIFDYQQKYMPGRAVEFTPARCSQETIKKIQDLCSHVATVLEMTNTSRTDGFVTTDGRIVIVDPNSLTGMGPSSFLFREAAHSNMSHSQLINHLIETELHHYGMLEAIIQKEQKEKKMDEKKIRVAVLLGGASNEKEISLESGRNVVYKLSPNKYTALPVFVASSLELFILDQKQLVLNSTCEIEQSLNKDTQIGWNDLATIADFVFIGLHGGVGENGCVQGTLEMLGIPYNGSSVLPSALCMDKAKTNAYLKHAGFSVPDSLLIAKEEWLLSKHEINTQIQQRFSTPLIIKPHNDGCSMLVQKINTFTELEPAIDSFFAHSTKTHVMIEELIRGMEITVGVVGNETCRALPPSQAVCAKDILSIEEKFLPGAGENQTPAPLPATAIDLIQHVMEEAYKTMGCSGYTRIDAFYQDATQSPTQQERVVILEFNTLPAMTPATCLFHQAAEMGLRPMEFVDLVVELGFEKHKQSSIQQATEKLCTLQQRSHDERQKMGTIS
jgi:D-alanine--D-alanine ligase